ncbi:MAG: D-2-hydroxyacid dehydrogenase [Anaerovoracaceae bacterium]
MKIVILEAETINPGDLSWEKLEAMGDLRVYPRTEPHQISSRIADAEAVYFSKLNMTGEIMDAHPSIKFMCVTATGTDNLDIAAAKERGIACTNVPGYATDAVAQHTFALILEATNHVGLHNAHVHGGGWDREKGFCYWLKPLHLLKDKTLGIVGYGSIGKKVAAIGEAFGMNVNIYSRAPEEALASDFVSLHIPATPETKHFINKDTISQMKDGACLINTARGSLVKEDDLADALRSGKITVFATDVLSHEPPVNGSPLMGMDNCIITPHNAWCPQETRDIICTLCADNLSSWLSGGTLNRVDLD